MIIDAHFLCETGTVIRCFDPRHAVVEFTEIGSNATVPTRFIVQISGAVPKPTLRVRRAKSKAKCDASTLLRFTHLSPL